MIHLLICAIFLLSAGCTTQTVTRDVASEKVFFPSNIHRANEVLLFGNFMTGSSVREFTRTLDKINASAPDDEKIKLRIFSELPANYETGSIPSPDFMLKEWELEDLSFTFRSRDLPDSLKHIIFYVENENRLAPSLWLQDYGQFFYTGDTPTFLDLNYSRIENTSELHRYIKSPKGIKGGVNNDFEGERTEATLNNTIEGGDLEVLPNGTLLTGNVIHPDLELFLTRELGQKLVKVPAEFMATGHVDEIFSIVPGPKNQTNGCGFALVHIDPLYGLRLALDRELKHTQTDNRAELINAIGHFTGGDGEQLIHRDRFNSIPDLFDPEKEVATTQEPWGPSPEMNQWYIYKTIEIHEKVKQGISKIKSELSETCPELKTVGLPVIFSDYAAGESTLFTEKVERAKSPKELSDAFKEAPVNMHFSPVNMIVLNEHLIMPSVQDLSPSNWSSEFSKSFESTYQWIIPLRLQSIGVEKSQIHFVDSNVFVANGGSLHCGSLTHRSKNLTVY